MSEHDLTNRQIEIVRRLVQWEKDGHSDGFVFRRQMGPRGVSPLGSDDQVSAEETDLLVLEAEGFLVLKDSRDAMQVGLRQRAHRAAAGESSRDSHVQKGPMQRLSLEGLHQGILHAVGDLFTDGHYSSAIFEAFKAVEVRVREMSGLNLSGRDLMAQAFNEKRPLIDVAMEKGRSGVDEQEGFQARFPGSRPGDTEPKGPRGDPVRRTTTSVGVPGDR